MVTTRTGAEVHALPTRPRRPARSPPRTRISVVSGVPINVGTAVYFDDEKSAEPPFHETNLGLLLIALALGLSIVICHYQVSDEVTSIHAPGWKFRPFGGGLSWIFPDS